jgi:phosphate:Na+ symporter
MSATVLILNLLGSVALLLWGIRMVRTGAQRAYGTALRGLLGRTLGNRGRAFLAGFAVTAVLQSSTATCLVVASFTGTAVVAGAAALAAMLGADVGTAVVAQFLSFNIAWAPPLLFLAGFAVFQSSSGRRWRCLGRLVMGLGLILLALSMIVHNAEPIGQSPLVLELVGALGGEPLIAVVLAALLTWLAHSSLATVLFIASLAATGALPVEAALVLVVGANLGGGIPAIVATWRSVQAARRVALGNGFFKLAGCIVALPLLGMAGALLATVDAEPARQVMLAHLGFNLILAAVFMPSAGIVARVLARLMPDRPEPEGVEIEQVRYLAATDLPDPGLALANAARETLRMGDVADRMLVGVATLLRGGDREALAAVSHLDDALDNLYGGIKAYLTEVRREPLEPHDSRRCGDIMDFTTNLEHVGDIIDNNLLDLVGKKMKYGLAFSDEGQAELDDILARLRSHLRLALNVFMSGDRGQARKLFEQKEVFRDLERDAQERHFERLQQGVAASIETSALHLDLLRDMKRINAHLTSVAYPILEETGELRHSRLRKKAS